MCVCVVEVVEVEVVVLGEGGGVRGRNPPPRHVPEPKKPKKRTASTPKYLHKSPFILNLFLSVHWSK